MGPLQTSVDYWALARDALPIVVAFWTTWVQLQLLRLEQRLNERADSRFASKSWAEAIEERHTKAVEKLEGKIDRLHEKIDALRSASGH